MRFFALSLTLLVASVAALAADVDGKWTGTAQTPQGDMPMLFTFKADGVKLTGTMQIGDFPAVNLKEGKVEGDKVSFTAELEFGANVFTLNFAGAQAGEELKMNIDAMGRSSEITLKKQKS